VQKVGNISTVKRELAMECEMSDDKRFIICVKFLTSTSVGFGVVVLPGIPCGEDEVVECEVPSKVPCGVGVKAEF